MVRCCLFQEPLKEGFVSKRSRRKTRNVCFFVSRKEGFVSRTRRNGAVLLLLVSRTPCFKNSKNQNFCFFVSGKKEEEGLSLFLKNCLFQEPLFLKNCLFQEPLFFLRTAQRRQQEKKRRQLTRCCSRRQGVLLFKKTRNKVFFCSTWFCFRRQGVLLFNQEPRC